MINMKKINMKLCALFAAVVILYPFPSVAGDKVMDLPPVTYAKGGNDIANETHPIVRLTPDKSELIRLDAAATSIIIGNPEHISVIADSAKLIVVIPKLPGATHFTVLGKNGQIIMQRHVIVASPKKDYLRVKRTCVGSDESCEDTSVFYCPDMCHEIRSSNQESASVSDDGAPSNSNASSNANNAPPVENTETE
ncbi:MAG: pilus assembly protein N-terminal domain-containing protein [Alphaproteobacteria bacterium]